MKVASPAIGVHVPRRTARRTPHGFLGVREGSDAPWSPATTVRLSDRARAAMRRRAFSVRTEEAYLGWMRRYWEFGGRRDPATLGAEQVTAFLSREEVRAALAHIEGDARLMATLLYGCGLRLLECCRLRVKDVDFDRKQITVRCGKGDKDRATMLPLAVKPAGVRSQIDRLLGGGP